MSHCQKNVFAAGFASQVTLCTEITQMWDHCKVYNFAISFIALFPLSCPTTDRSWLLQLLCGLSNIYESYMHIYIYLYVYVYTYIYRERGGGHWCKICISIIFRIVTTLLFSLMTVIFDNLYTKSKGAHTLNVTAINGEIVLYQCEIWLWHVAH